METNQSLSARRTRLWKANGCESLSKWHRNTRHEAVGYQKAIPSAEINCRHAVCREFSRNCGLHGWSGIQTPGGRSSSGLQGSGRLENGGAERSEPGRHLVDDFSRLTAQ